jgi:hypothetical protein
MLKLVGHSGCDLIFLKSGDKLVIRKLSKDVNYNSRLKLQCIKQQEFFHDHIKAPRVLETGEIDNLFYFDMEYINGIRFNDYVKIKNFNDVKKTFNTIINFVLSNFRDNLIVKQNEIESKIGSIVSTNLVDVNTINQLLMLSNEPILSGYCHGDLTFENIIISNGVIYLIDFLDSYIDSPIIDISKLLQEFDLNWSNRNDEANNNLSIIRNIFLKRILFDKIVKKGINQSSLLLQQKLTLMRILPYTNSITLKLKLIELINN